MAHFKDIYYLHLEISNLCNAACPCCPRFNSNTPLPSKHLPLGYIDLKSFKEWFPPEILKRIRRLNFCGNHGDPGTNPDFPEIVEYCAEHSSYESFSFHTNGGMLNPSFWTKLAKACNKVKSKERVKPVFSIDGLEDTNHIYRRNVKWDKLMKNVKAFNEVRNPKVHTTWDFLVFKHNEHQLEKARKLSMELRFKNIEFKAPLNLDDGVNITPVPVLSKDGAIMYWLNPTVFEEFKPSYLAKNPKKVYKNQDKWKEIGFDWNGKVSDDDKKMISKAEPIKIRPRCGQNDLYVESNGDVHPCCFVATKFYEQKSYYLDGKGVNIANRQQLDYMNKVGFDKFNLNTTTLKEMIDNRELKKMYNDNWKKTVGEGKMIKCAEYCGQTNAIDVIYGTGREDINTERSHAGVAAAKKADKDYEI